MEALGQIRTQLYLGFLALPMLLMSLIFFLAIGLGNVGLFVLFIGHAFIVPLLLLFVHGILGSTSLYGSGNFYKPSSDIAQLVTSSPHTTGAMVSVAPSLWMAHVLFFLTYLFSNAASIYNLPRTINKKGKNNLSDFYYENRKAKASAIMVITALAALALSMARFYTGAETIPGILVAFVTCGAVGYGWYKFAEKCGARHADVFGIVPQLLPANAKEETAITCAYAPKP